MLSYFTPASFARAKQHREELEKSNPQKPVLADEDEKFLERVASAEQEQDIAKHGEHEEDDAAGGEAQEPMIPETRSDEPSTPTTRGKKSRKDKGIELPSQEDAEAATRGWESQVQLDEAKGNDAQPRTWASYLPKLAMTTVNKDGTSTAERPSEHSQSAGADPPRSWAQYAASYAPPVPSSWTFRSSATDPDAAPSPVYRADGTLDAAATKERQEREVSVLLDQLSLSSINSQVFALNVSTQRVYGQFAAVLRDTVAGAPTAYDDMERLLREAGPQLERQFAALPPFVQTLVKSLPARLGTSLAPELLAVTAQKPGAEIAATNEPASAPTPTEKAKRKRAVPGLKALMKRQGAVAGILRSAVAFVQTRFPFLASATNVVMSLAVFLLMFVFWYCHKRGKETRLAREQVELGEGVDEDDERDDGIDEKDDDEKGDEQQDRCYENDATLAASIARDVQERMDHPQPSQVPTRAGEE